MYQKVKKKVEKIEKLCLNVEIIPSLLKFQKSSRQRTGTRTSGRTRMNNHVPYENNEQ